MWKLFIILGLGIAATHAISPIKKVSVNNVLQTPESRQQELTYRLPTNVRPIKYVLDISVEVNDDVFIGNVTIILEVTSPTTSIHINYKDISVGWSNARLTLDASSQTFQLTNQIDRLVEQIYELHFEPSLGVGTYSLELQFNGTIRSDLTGLYKSSYAFANDTLQETRFIVATHLEPTYARSLFPCFDEPAFKAKFLVTIYHAQKYRAISNMPVQNDPEIIPGMNNFFKTSFQETKVNMSTYLFAFVLAEEYEEYSEPPGILRVVASAHDIHRVTFAQQFGYNSLTWFETWLNRDYQLEKLDMVNIPKFFFGAMENWGLIMFRDPYLLRDITNLTSLPVRVQQSGALLITHELAHMWFGNEVTPEFWTYIWMSEGFARFFEYYTTDILIPEWYLMNQFLVTNFQSSLSQDDKISARAMTSPVSDPNVINNMFDYIVYAKSACVIRMFQHVIGINIFQDALRAYITDRSYSTTNPDHLFSHFQNAIIGSGLNFPGTFKSMFETWSNHPGYPLVKVTRNTVFRTMLFEQTRFFVNPSEADGRSYAERSIPINFAISNNRNFLETRPDFWMSPNSSEQSRTINGPENDNWVVVNKQLTGYYRVQYDQHNYDLLIAEMNSDNWSNIHVLNRAQLLDDAINLAKARLINIKIALAFLNSLRRERDLPDAYVPWATANNALSYLNVHLKGRSHYELFQAFVANISSNAYSNVKVNVRETRHLHRIHRLSVARWACLMGLEACLGDVKEIINGMLNGSFQIIDEIKDFVYCSAVQFSEELTTSLGTRLITLFITPGVRNDEEIYHLITGLACSTNETVINSYLELIITSSPFIPMTSEDRLYLFKAIAGGSASGLNRALNFLETNFLAARNRFGANNLVDLFKYLGPLMNSQGHINHINAITNNFGTSLTSEQHEAVFAAISRARENIEWLSYHEERISEWLTANVDIPEGGSGAVTIIVNISLLACLLISIGPLLM